MLKKNIVEVGRWRKEMETETERGMLTRRHSDGLAPPSSCADPIFSGLLPSVPAERNARLRMRVSLYGN